jgi:hypothetical protein
VELQPVTRARRRAVVRVGLCLLVAATGIACIFDKGNGYEGGGRRDTTKSTADNTATATVTTPTSTTTTTSGTDGGGGGTDSGGGGTDSGGGG